MKRSDKIYRDPANGKLMGVCAGLAKAFQVDPLWVRLGVVFLTIVTNFILLPAYILLGLLLPTAPEDGVVEHDNNARPAAKNSPSMFADMRSEPVNKQSVPDPIDWELEQLKAERFEQQLNEPTSASTKTYENAIPKSLEGDTSGRKGRSLEGTPANKRKV